MKGYRGVINSSCRNDVLKRSWIESWFMMVSHEDMSPRQRTRDVEVILPNGACKTVQVSSPCTVNELKIICEACFGIPTELQKISLFEDGGNGALRNCILVPQKSLKLDVPIWWTKFICGVLRNEIENVFRRVQLPMQQVGKDERIFVALFMGACCGMEDLVARMARLKTKVNLSSATDTGRTLLHACALSGSLKCLEIIIKHLMSLGLESLEKVDVNKENAYQIAKKLDHKDLAEQLLYFMNAQTNQDETCRPSVASAQSEESSPVATRSSNSPHQTQANTDRKINMEAISNERLVEKNKHSIQSDVKEDIDCNDEELNESNALENVVLTKCEEEYVKSNEEGNCTFMKQEKTEKTSDMPVNGLRSSPVDDTNHSTERLSISDEKLASPTKVSSLLSRRRGNDQNICNTNAIVYVPNINFDKESSEDELELKTRLPSLRCQNSLTGHAANVDNFNQVQHRAGRKLVFRSMSSPNSPDTSPVMSPRISPTSEVSPVLTGFVTDTKSAPTSPLARRAKTFRAVGMTARFAVNPYINPPNSPTSRAKVSREPLALAAPNIGNAGVKFNRFRRGSLAVGNEGVKVPLQRGKSRSVCEVTLCESLNNHLLNKTMETEERMDLPWNAWIAAKRRESVVQTASTLAPMPENQQLHVPASPSATRRRSFQQWLNEKDMEQLRQLHEQSQIDERNDAERTGRQVKGKSFEEWLEDKHRESQREKEKLKEKEEVEKSEAEKKQRRRRMSQQKYQSWLQEKELKALEEEEKLLGEAKLKLEKMKVKWEEEDEIKKKAPAGKLPVGRTKSCPTSNPGDQSRKISRHRFTSLQVTSK